MAIRETKEWQKKVEAIARDEAKFLEDLVTCELEEEAASLREVVNGVQQAVKLKVKLLKKAD